MSQAGFYNSIWKDVWENIRKSMIWHRALRLTFVPPTICIVYNQIINCLTGALCMFVFG